MKLFEILHEAIDDDVSAQQQAFAAYRIVAKAVAANNFIEIELPEERHFYGLEPSKIGLLNVPPELLIMIGVKTSQLSVLNGAIWVIDGNPWMGKYSSVLVVHGLREFTEDELKKCVNSTNFVETFQHEFIHVLDNDRTQGKIIARGPIDSTNRHVYLNDPAEFNAYYHQFADNWLSCLGDIQKNPEDADDLKSLYNISGNFQTDLKKLINRSPYSKKFFETLNETRRKSIMKRLFRLYQELMSVK